MNTTKRPLAADDRDRALALRRRLSTYAAGGRGDIQRQRELQRLAIVRKRVEWGFEQRVSGVRRLVTQLAALDGRALGTALRIVVTDPALLSPAEQAVARVLNEVDLTCSRFRADSELTRLNTAAGREVEVSPLLARAIAAALRGARLTQGAVDPTVAEAVKAAGYTVDFAAVPADGEALHLVVRSVPGWQRVTLYEESRRVYLPPGVELDLGATAKALAADIAAEAVMETAGHGGVLVGIGGDIAVGGTPPADGWHIQVADDSEAPMTSDAETVRITSGGIATSSTTVRSWTRGGVVLHHIIDPATGLPASGPWRTVSVCAGTCLDANIAATAAVVRGDAALSWLESTGLPARLVDQDGGVTRIAGWPSPP
jgi:thiamine biosynthesis lipoprotein ApbE